MPLSAEDRKRLRALDDTNRAKLAAEKLASGKPLSQKERTLLQLDEDPSIPSKPSTAYAHTFDELADRLGVSRKSLQNWRDPAKRPDLAGKFPKPQADGRHDVAAWCRFMIEHGLDRADERVDPDDLEDGPRTVQDWKKRREMRECQRIERAMLKDDQRLLVATELEVAFGQLFAGIQASLTMLPGSEARFLVGLRDVHVVQQRLQDAVDALLTQLNLGLYLDDTIAEAAAGLPADPAIAQRFELVTFAGQDRAALLDVIAHCAREVFARVGRRAIAKLTRRSRDADDADKRTEVPLQCAASLASEVVPPPPRPVPQSRQEARSHRRISDPAKADRPRDRQTLSQRSGLGKPKRSSKKTKPVKRTFKK